MMQELEKIYGTNSVSSNRENLLKRLDNINQTFFRKYDEYKILKKYEPESQAFKTVRQECLDLGALSGKLLEKILN